MNEIPSALIEANRRMLGMLATLALTGGPLGCATTGAEAGQVTSPPDKPHLQRLGDQNARQAGRIRELEARLALLEAESRGQRSARPLSETVRIGGEETHGPSSSVSPGRDAPRVRRAERLLGSEAADAPGAPDAPDAWRRVETSDDRPPIALRLYGKRRSDPEPAAAPLPPVPLVDERLPVATLPVSPLPPAGTLELPAHAHDGAGAASGQVEGAQVQQRVKQRYLAALRHLKARAYVRAGDAFALFIADYPAHHLADPARYWLAESRYAERDYRRALGLFERYLARVTTGDRAAEAMHKAGLCQLRLGNRVAAERFFARLRAQFPDSAAVAALTTASAEGSP